LRDRDVVHVALAEAGVGDADDLRIALQVGNRRRAAVAHAGAQAAHQLVHDHRHAALVLDASLDALGHEFFHARLAGRARAAFELEVVLEVTIAAAAAHRADRPHAAVFLEGAALIQDQLAGAFIGPGKQITGHHRAFADRTRLDTVP